MDNKPAYYGILPANVRYDNRLKPMEKIMYSEVTALSNSYGYCDAGNSYFAELYDVDSKTVGRWLKSLKNYGYIEVDQDEITGHNRKIYPRDQKVTPRDKKITPLGQKDHPPRDKKITHNNTSIILQDNSIEVAFENTTPRAMSEDEVKEFDKQSKTKRKRFAKPTLSELIEFFQKKLREKKVLGSDRIGKAEAEKFYNYYEANGWKVGRNKMSSWPHAVGGWISRMKNYQTHVAKDTGTIRSLKESGAYDGPIISYQ